MCETCERYWASHTEDRLQLEAPEIVRYLDRHVFTALPGDSSTGPVIGLVVAKVLEKIADATALGPEARKAAQRLADIVFPEIAARIGLQAGGYVATAPGGESGRA